MILRALVSVILVLSYFLLPKYGFTDVISIDNWRYQLSHANIWHLLANIVCLWMVRTDLNLLPCYCISTVCSFLPCFVDEPTMGFSGMLFAMVGISWGRVHRFKDMVWRNKWFLFIPIFIPHVNAMIHLYCMVMGYLFGLLYPERRYWL
jgi:membrane associated rhomboid family serine protease